MKMNPGKTLPVIAALCILLSGCINDQYAVEKKFWQCTKQAEKIFRNPVASPPKEVEKVVGFLNSFIQRYPNTRLSVEAEFNISRIYIAKEDYEQARSQLRMIMNKYSKADAVCSEALFMTGVTYQLQNKWGSALEQFKKIMETYPLTLKGLDVPMYIAQYYRAKHQPDKMIAAYHDAAAHYQALADKHPNTPAAFIGYKMVAQSYLAVKDWQKVIGTYQVMLEKFRGKVAMDGILMDMCLIYKKELKDGEKAKHALEVLIKEYPKSKFSRAATVLLKEMNKK